MTKAQQLRQTFRSLSNNPDNPNKNKCVFHVAYYLAVDDEVRYLHTSRDLVRAARKEYTVRSRRSYLPKSATVGGSRNRLKKLAEVEYKKGYKVYGFIVVVPEHVLFLGPDGQTVVDTAPRKRDVRPVREVYLVRSVVSAPNRTTNKDEILRALYEGGNLSGESLGLDVLQLTTLVLELIEEGYVSQEGEITERGKQYAEKEFN